MTRLGMIGGAALALSACTMADYGGYGGYPPAAYDAAPPPPAYTATDVLDAYAYIDRADSLWDAIGDAPPDHSFAFEGAEPWAWQTEGGFWVVVEDGSDGIRSYYFEPGEDAPFLVVEPGHSYGFEGDAVAVVYGPDGGVLPRTEGTEYLDDAVALFARGRRIRATLTQGQWQPVDTQAWVDTSPLIFTSMISIWDTGPQRYPEWRSYRDRSDVRASDWRHRLEAERLRRRAMSDAFKRWREGGYQGPPPGRWRRPGEDRPGVDRPNRPDGPRRPGVGRPDRPATTPASGTPQQPGTGRPDRPRPGWNGQRPNRPRPDGSPGRPTIREPIPGTVPATAEPVAPAAGERPRRPEGMWRPRPRPDASQPGTSAPAAPPAAGTPRPPRNGARPAWRDRPAGETQTPRPNRPAWQPRPEGAAPSRPERPTFSRPAPQPRPSYTPAPQPRPSYSPPAQVQRPSPPPRTAPAPRPRPSKLPSDGDRIE